MPLGDVPPPDGHAGGAAQARAAGRRGRRRLARGDDRPVEELDPAWRETLDLAWAAYRAGTIPVGAVVLDGSGRVVARGRNRIFDGGGSRLLHAEVNALLELGTATYEDHVLLTSLEPCHLCTAAAYAARVGTVRFAARDAYGGGVGRLLPVRDIERHPVSFEGPALPQLEPVLELLLVAHHVARRPDGDVVSFFRELRPERVRQAELLVAAGDPPSALADALPGLLRHAT